MKIKSDMWQVTGDKNRNAMRRKSSRHSSPVTRHSQNGVALVITLILLSVTLVMAVAFLFISRREQGSVATQTDAATARYAADAALANAEAQIAANMLASSPPNPYNFGLLVSTNYLVSPLVPNNPLGDLTNLFISPRLPVYMSNLVAHAMENRFYLDLNRNGRYDTNGISGEFDNNNNLISTNFHV